MGHATAASTVAASVALLGAANAASVIDESDEFTDERRLSVLVLSERDPRYAGGSIRFRCRDDESFTGIDLRVSTDEGRSWPSVSYIPVTLRFDAQNAIVDDTSFETFGGALYSTDGEPLLKSALGSDRLLFRVALDPTMRFDLAAARPQLIEFKRRCTAMLGRDAPTAE